MFSEQKNYISNTFSEQKNCLGHAQNLEEYMFRTENCRNAPKYVFRTEKYISTISQICFENRKIHFKYGFRTENYQCLGGAPHAMFYNMSPEQIKRYTLNTFSEQKNCIPHRREAISYNHNYSWKLQMFFQSAAAICASQSLPAGSALSPSRRGRSWRQYQP